MLGKYKRKEENQAVKSTKKAPHTCKKRNRAASFYSQKECAPLFQLLWGRRSAVLSHVQEGRENRFHTSDCPDWLFQSFFEFLDEV